MADGCIDRNTARVNTCGQESVAQKQLKIFRLRLLKR
jgi:hypothetical protein